MYKKVTLIVWFYVVFCVFRCFEHESKMLYLYWKNAQYHVKYGKTTCVFENMIYNKNEKKVLICRKGEGCMINTDAFNYINVLDKAADASWMRETAIANNIANVDTPGYKRIDVDFETTLRRELGNAQYITLDEKVKNVDLDKLNVQTYTDSAGYSYRIDENNVDVDTENVELASEQIRYEALTGSCINSEFQRLASALGK